MYTFPNQGPFTIGFSGGAWMALDYGSPSSWNVQTIVDLRFRNDTNRPNSSPISGSRPMYKIQYGCQNKLQIPMTDADGDNVKCRWSVGNECASVCRGLPNAYLDQNTCTITFTSDTTNSYKSGGWYAVAVTVEDYPTSAISIGGNTILPTKPISSIPIQFLINTPGMSGKCDDRPVFVNNTPSENSVLVIKSGQSLAVEFYALSSYGIKDITLMSPAGLQKSSLLADKFGRTDVRYISISWTPLQSQKGAHLLCVTAEDNQGKMSDPRCVTLLAWDNDPCDSYPCQNNGTCVRVGYTQDYSCICGPGYTGLLCDTRIDHCKSSPCLHGGECVNQLITFACDCMDQWYGYICEYNNFTSKCTFDYSECTCVIGQMKRRNIKNNDLLCGFIGMVLSLIAVIISYISWTFYRRNSKSVRKSRVQPNKNMINS